MRQLLLCVGKLGGGAYGELFQHYIKQIRGTLEVIEISDAPPSSSAAARKAKEAEALLAKLPPQSYLIALDARGKHFTSEAFSDLLAEQAVRGTKQLTYMIGGQDGLDETIIKRAQCTLALGSMIWPHKLARVMLAEQIFRAQCIRSGHPYHAGHA